MPIRIFITLWLGALCAASTLAATAARPEPELLDADVAFKLSAQIRDATSAEVRFTIAPGYYMYRARFGFEVDGAPVRKPALPRGKNKFDATFNKTMEVYRNEVTARLPLAQAAGTVMLKVTSQGCADAGVCYPPQVQTLRLTSASSAPGASGARVEAGAGALPFSSSSAAGASARSATGAGAALSAVLARSNTDAAARDPAFVPPAVGASATATRQAKASSPSHARFDPVTSTEDAAQKIKAAAGRFVLLDFYADWCAPCKQMEKATFSDQRVKARLAQFAALQADVTRNTLDDKLLLKQYKLMGPPGILFFDRTGQEITALRVVGFEAPDKFLQRLDQALSVR